MYDIRIFMFYGGMIMESIPSKTIAKPIFDFLMFSFLMII